MSCLMSPEIRATFICILSYKHTHTVRTLSSSHDYIQMQVEGHRHPSGLTRKQSPCTGRCNFLSHFPCMDSNYWSWARQRRQLIMNRYDNHWLIGQHIKVWTSRLKGQMEERETGSCTQMEPHKHTCIFPHGGYTLCWLAVSSSSLFLLFSTLCTHPSQCAAIKKTSTCLLNWKLVVKKRERERERMRSRDQGSQARVWTR